MADDESFKSAFDIPQFGTRHPEAEYYRRAGVYAIIPSEVSEVVVTLLPCGAYHLPGGGIEAGESELDALTREVREECDLIIRPLQHVGRANQYVYSAATGSHFNKLCSYYAAEVVAAREVKGRGEDQWLWMNAAEAVRQLEHESHAWAVARYFHLPRNGVPTSP